MKRDVVSVDYSQFVSGLKRYKTMVVGGAAVRELHLAGLDLEKEAAALAPIDEGHLQDQGSTEQPKKQRGGWEVRVGFNAPYATKQHEDLKPAPGATMNPGPKTRVKMPTKYGAPGGKYLERPLTAKAEQYMREIANAMAGVE